MCRSRSRVSCCSPISDSTLSLLSCTILLSTLPFYSVVSFCFSSSVRLKRPKSPSVEALAHLWLCVHSLFCDTWYNLRPLSHRLRLYFAQKTFTRAHVDLGSLTHALFTSVTRFVLRRPLSLSRNDHSKSLHSTFGTIPQFVELDTASPQICRYHITSALHTIRKKQLHLAVLRASRSNLSRSGSATQIRQYPHLWCQWIIQMAKHNVCEHRMGAPVPTLLTSLVR